jgi:cytochrome d ubiquinol oxidase subunit II
VFLCSALFLLGMLTSVAFGLFPYVLPSNTEPNLSLTAYNTAPAEYGLRVGLAWWIPGMALAAGYSIFTHWKFAGKVRASEDVIEY